VTALRAAFDAEREWLRDADDQRAVLDRLAGYRVNLATARRGGNAQGHAFAEHLVELAEDRLAELKALAMRAQEREAAPKPPPRTEAPPRAAPTPPPEPPARPTSAAPRLDDSDIVRRLQAALAASKEGERRASRERDDAERRAREAGEERDAARAAQRTMANAQAPTPPSRAPVGNAARLERPATLPSVASGARPASTAKPAVAATTATTTTTVRPTSLPARPTRVDAPVVRAAAPTGPPRTAQPAPAAISTPSTQPKASPPPPARAAEAATLTGADLAAFRRAAGLTQVAAAQRLGVTQGTISKAEGNPRTVLGPALQEALRHVAG
jgi:DNA-binding transcriptional regulator YiaG